MSWCTRECRHTVPSRHEHGLVLAYFSSHFHDVDSSNHLHLYASSVILTLKSTTGIAGILLRGGAHNEILRLCDKFRPLDDCSYILTLPWLASRQCIVNVKNSCGPFCHRYIRLLCPVKLHVLLSIPEFIKTQQSQISSSRRRLPVEDIRKCESQNTEISINILCMGDNVISTTFTSAKNVIALIM